MNLNSYAPREIDGQMHVWYQGVGWQPAKPASEIQAGDRLIYNYGYTAKVLNVIKETAKTIIFEVESKSSGTIHQQRIRKSTYWGIKEV